MSVIDKQYYQQQYLSSMIRTERLFKANVDRWNRAKDLQAREILIEHAKRAGLPINNEVNDGIRLAER